MTQGIETASAAAAPLPVASSQEAIPVMHGAVDALFARVLAQLHAACIMEVLVDLVGV